MSKLCWCDWQLFLAWEKASAQVKGSLEAHQYKLMMFFTLKIHARRTRIIYVFPIYESLPSSGCTHWKGGKTMRNPSVMSPDCGLQYHFSLKGKKKLMPGLRQDMHRTSLDHTVIWESKERLQDNQCGKRTQQPSWREGHSSLSQGNNYTDWNTLDMFKSMS